MSRILHVAKVWQIEYRYPGLYGCDGQDVFYNILEMFDVRNSAEDIYTDDFEIERSELQRLKRHISGRDDTFRQHAEAFHAELEKIGMDTDGFIAVLDNLINDSDQSDDFIHVSWF